MKKLDVPQSGSQADTTASRNRYGQYNRTRRTPVNPNTAAQSAARSRLTDLSRAWSGLDETDRLAWAAFAEAHPRTDSLGQSNVLTGHQAYVSVNCARMAAGLDPVDVPTGATETVTACTVELADDGFDVAFAPSPVPSDHKLVIEASGPVSPGRSYNGDYRFVASVDAAATTPQDVLTDWEAKFGSAEDHVGKKVFVRAYFVGPSGDTARVVATGVISGGA